ncbi:MAG TPA: hypothetical protein VGN51_09860 [Acidimicrobiia bacterium]|jgi:hypothetical protein
MKKSRFVALAVLALALAVGGIAFAYWTQGGSGSGGATAGTTSAITVNQTGTPTGLYPGGPAVPLSGTFDNPNAHPVHISSVTVVVTPFSVQTDNAKPACTAADFAVGGASGANVVPAGTGVGSWSGLTVRLVDGVANQDNCKNVNITLDYTANP